MLSLFSCNITLSIFITADFPSASCEIESLEGAAFHFVCLHEQLPFLQLRAISNIVGERNKKNWHLKEAVHNLNNKLITLIKELP